MGFFGEWLRRFQYLINRRSLEEQLKREMETHREMMEQPQRFGNALHLREQSRDVWGWKWLDDLWHDTRHATRQSLQAPAFTLVVILSLALGIGSITAVFSVMDALLLKRLPVRKPDELVLLTNVTRTEPHVHDMFSYPVFEQLRQRSSALALFAVSARAMRMSSAGGDEQFESVQVSGVSGGYFSVLGIAAASGRLFTEKDAGSADTNAVAVISYGFWQRRFGLDPQVIGRRITLDNRPFTIIGVAPRGFSGIEVGRSHDLWLPLVPSNELRTSESLWLNLMARVRPGITSERATAEMDALLRQLKSETTPSGSRFFFNFNDVQRIVLMPGGTGRSPLLRPQFTGQLVVLMIIAALALLIVCANVANLLLTRGLARRREIAVRLAIGGGRGRLFRQLLTESVALAALGGALGLFLAHWGTRFLLTYLPQRPGTALNAAIDGRAFLFMMSVSALSVMLLGVFPAIRMMRLDLGHFLKNQAADPGLQESRFTFQRALLVLQIAISLILLVGGGLFVRTLHNLRTFDAGFERDTVVRFSLDQVPGYSLPQRLAMHKGVLARLEGMPGLSSITVFSCGLLDSCSNGGGLGEVEGYTFQPNEDRRVEPLYVGSRFFETVGLSLASGRDFVRSDEATNPNFRVGVINQKLARKYFSDANPVGRHMSFNGIDIEIIGVAKDAKYRSLREETFPVVYVPFAIDELPRSFVLRTHRPVSELASAIRESIREIDPALRANAISTMGEIADAAILQERLVAQIASFFGIMALFLAGIGLFGILSYVVKRRTREVAIRIAVGARRSHIIVMLMRELLPVIAIGVTIGLAGALGLMRFSASLLFGVAPTDPSTIVGAVALLVIAAGVATFLPARRASRANATMALRCE